MITYFSATFISKTDNHNIRKSIGIACVCITIGLWSFFKYLGIAASPIGISFYSFIALSYLIDIYREKYPVEINFFKYLTFITFFAHIVQGPFSRYDQLTPSLFAKHKFNYTKFGEGILRITFGIFKKLVIANRLLVVMDNILNENNGYGGIYIIILIIVLPVQLYTDFSGYMDIACGLCHILGIELQENFKQPIFSKSIDEFWRRWHITLGAWFKDYVFYTVSMGKLSQKLTRWAKKHMSRKNARMLPSYVALICVWTATGLWHGRSWNYICWGWLNLFCIITSMLLKDTYIHIKTKLRIDDSNKLWIVFQITRTFMIFGLAELISDSESMSQALRFIKNIFCIHNYYLILNPLSLFIGIDVKDLIIIFFGLCVVLFVDIIKEKGGNVYYYIHRSNILIRYILCSTFLYITILFSYVDNGLGGFAYAQF